MAWKRQQEKGKYDNAVHDNITQFNACNNLNGGLITSILMDIDPSDKKHS
jgi:hypothetical protein